MKLLKLNLHAEALHRGSAVTIGNFDGVHLGHQNILTRLLIKSRELGVPSVVIVFEPQPKELFAPQKRPMRIYTLREKLYHIKDVGFDYALVIKFNHQFARLSAEQFITTILHKTLCASYILIGHDFRFGKGRLGCVKLLNKYKPEYKFLVEEFHIYIQSRHRVSSTLIRALLKANDLKQVSYYLGRDYSIIGRVIHGRKLAREWGFPTANIAILPEKLSLQGVFCVKIKLCATAEEYDGVANIGTRPTIDGVDAFLEVFILNFSRSLYGQLLEVTFCHQLRNEQRFASVDELKKQIQIDVNSAIQYFNLKLE